MYSNVSEHNLCNVKTNSYSNVGQVALQVLLEIERRTGKQTVELFDWVAGSSIGSLIVLALKHRQLTMRDMQRILFDVKNKVDRTIVAYYILVCFTHMGVE